MNSYRRQCPPLFDERTNAPMKSQYYPDVNAPGYAAQPQQQQPTVIVLPPQQQQPQRQFVPQQQHQPVVDSVPTGLPVGTGRPTYLGATTGHHAQVMTCEHCGYSGPADVAKVNGAASCFAAILTFGLSSVCCRDAFADTYQHCANCDAVLAYAKLA